MSYNDFLEIFEIAYLEKLFPQNMLTLSFKDTWSFQNAGGFPQNQSPDEN